MLHACTDIVQHSHLFGVLLSSNFRWSMELIHRCLSVPQRGKLLLVLPLLLLAYYLRLTINYTIIILINYSKFLEKVYTMSSVVVMSYLCCQVL